MPKITWVATWAFCVLTGAIMLTPEGLVIISANPALRVGLGIVLIVLGLASFIIYRTQRVSKT